jgi:molybdenum ABC transporter molybdate-binding protein
MIVRVALALVVATMSAPTIAAETIQLYAAGSLRSALSELARSFAAVSGHKVQAKFGASGLLKDEILDGAHADLFASANMEHPQTLAAAGKSGPVWMFARNRLCALVRPGLAVEPATLLERMLDPNVKLGTSTPRADPSGDYAWEVFRKGDNIRPGAFATLEKKALQLVGGPNSPAAPPGRALYGMLVNEGKADIFLTYCTNAHEASEQNPGQRVVALPEALAVGADYGLTLINGAPPAAMQLAAIILSSDGQSILARYGFAPPAASK